MLSNESLDPSLRDICALVRVSPVIKMRRAPPGGSVGCANSGNF